MKSPRPLTVSHATTVAAAASDIYAVVADAARREEWLAEIASIDAPPAPLTAGDRFRARTSLVFHVFEGVSEVIRAEPDAVLVEDVVVGAHFTSTWALRPDAGGGTTVEHRIELSLPGGPLGRLERWVLGRRLRAMQRASLRRLAELFSSAAGGPSGPSGH